MSKINMAADRGENSVSVSRIFVNDTIAAKLERLGYSVELIKGKDGTSEKTWQHDYLISW